MTFDLQTILVQDQTFHLSNHAQEVTQLLEALKETPNQFSDLSRIEYSDIDNSVDLSRKLMSRLYYPKGKSKRCHIDLNKLRVKLATVKDSTLVELST
jgi:5-bromo-4-chloroindolyl phosphate hydrolysis protein